MWSAHPLIPKANGEAQITKWTAKLGNFSERVGQPLLRGRNVFQSQAWCVQTYGYKVCRIPSTESSHRLQPGQGQRGIKRGWTQLPEQSFPL